MAISMGMQVAWLLEHGKQYSKNFFGSFFEANPLLVLRKKPFEFKKESSKVSFL
jgi:hypothetical protein